MTSNYAMTTPADDPNHHALADAVCRISSSSTSLSDVSSMVNDSLEALGTACAADRAYVFLFDHERETADNTHEWCAAGIAPAIATLQNLPLQTFPWWMKKLRRGETILIPDVRLLPDEAVAERAILEQQDVRSVLVLPLYCDGCLGGFVGLDNVRTVGNWDPASRRHVEVASRLIGNMITREVHTQRIQDRTRELATAYDELKRTQSKLLQSDKLASIGLLAAGIAHEINNPVAFLKSNEETIASHVRSIRAVVDLYRSGADAEEVRAHPVGREIDVVMDDLEAVSRANAQGLRRVAAIVDKLTRFYRSGSPGTYEPSDLNQGIQDTIAIAAVVSGDATRIEFTPGEIPRVSCSSGEMNQVFLNVVINAAQAVSDNDCRTDCGIRIRTFADDDYVNCVFDDDGPGLTPEVTSRIFDPFFTTKGPGQGTGLGMSIAYDIVVNKHGGELSAGNHEGGGARILVRIPRSGPTDPGA